MKLCLKIILITLCLTMISSLSGNTGEQRMLKFFHTHTGDTLDVVYFQQGEYNPEALADIKVLLADWRDDKQHDIDPTGAGHPMADSASHWFDRNLGGHICLPFA